MWSKYCPRATSKGIGHSWHRCQLSSYSRFKSWHSEPNVYPIFQSNAGPTSLPWFPISPQHTRWYVLIVLLASRGFLSPLTRHLFSLPVSPNKRYNNAPFTGPIYISAARFKYANRNSKAAAIPEPDVVKVSWAHGSSGVSEQVSDSRCWTSRISMSIA